MIRSNTTRMTAGRAMVTRALDVVPRYRSILQEASRSFGAVSSARALGGIKNTNVYYGGSSSIGAIHRITRQFNFTSSQYDSCFDKIPTPDVEKLRKDATVYLDSFDKQLWHDDPVRTSKPLCTAVPDYTY